MAGELMMLKKCLFKSGQQFMKFIFIDMWEGFRGYD